jgi:hypothetical protein
MNMKVSNTLLLLAALIFTASDAQVPVSTLHFGTTSGVPTAGHCLNILSANSSGVTATDSGAACGTGTGSVTGVTASSPLASSGGTAPNITLGQVTDAFASLENKPSVGLVATSNLTLSGAQTIDSVAGTVGTTLVLATAQTTTSQNGPWVMQTGAWTRPAWYPTGGTTQALQFSTTLARLGLVYQGTAWRQTAAAPITIGTTPTTWAITPFTLGSTSVGGTLPAAAFPALSGDTTTVAGSLATTTAKSNGNAFPTLATVLGDIWYGSAGSAMSALAGSTSATKQYLTQTGNGTVSAAPAWGTIQAADVPTLNQSTTGTATTATNVAGGALGSVPYQTASGTTALLAGNTTVQAQVLCQTGTGSVSAVPGWCNYLTTLLQSGLPVGMPSNGYMDTTGNFMIGANPPGSATAVLTATSGTAYITFNNANALLGTSADVGRVVSVREGAGPYTYNSWTGTVLLTSSAAIGTISGTGTLPATTATISGVTISSTSGQLACTCSGFVVGQTLTISGTYGGTGSITGYVSPTTYYVSVVTSTTNITLQSINGTTAPAAIVTTTGTPTGLTYTPGGTATIANAAMYETGSGYPAAQATVDSVTLPAPLNFPYAAAYLYFPASAPVGTLGLYYCVPFSMGAGTCYNNTYSQTGGGTPTIPASPTAFSGLTAGTYTQTTATGIVLGNANVPANSMSLNGCAQGSANFTVNNSANTKTAGLYVVNMGPSSTVPFTTQNDGYFTFTACNSNNAKVNVFNATRNNSGSTATIIGISATRNNADTTVANLAKGSCNLATATDTCMMEQAQITVRAN